MITRERLIQVAEYDEKTGIFRSRGSRGKLLPNSIMGTVRKSNGYVQLCIDRKLYYAHRLAILYVTGENPKDTVDHINGVRSDNSIKNLRCVDRKTNSQNRRGPDRDSSTGYLGVKKANQKSGYVASIFTDGKSIHIGTFKTKEEAYDAYISYKRRLHGGCTI